MMELLQFPCKILFSTTKWPEENFFPLEIFHDDHWLYNDIKKHRVCVQKRKRVFCVFT